jgi:hypothetical protein
MYTPGKSTKKLLEKLMGLRMLPVTRKGKYKEVGFYHSGMKITAPL